MPVGKGEVNTTMKYSLVIALILGSAAAQPTPAPAPSKTKAKAEVKKPAALVVPAGAVEIEPNIFKYTDKSGKATYYRKSPFGVSYYSPEKAVPKSVASNSAPSSSETQAYDQGDSVKFIRPGPFGNYTWIRKKSELNEDEKEAFDKSKPNSETAKTQAASPKKEQ